MNLAEIEAYEFAMESQLDAITIPFSALHGSVLCLDSCHCTSLEGYFCDIVKADLVLPRIRHGISGRLSSQTLIINQLTLVISGV